MDFANREENAPCKSHGNGAGSTHSADTGQAQGSCGSRRSAGPVKDGCH